MRRIFSIILVISLLVAFIPTKSMAKETIIDIKPISKSYIDDLLKDGMISLHSAINTEIAERLNSDNHTESSGLFDETSTLTIKFTQIDYENELINADFVIHSSNCTIFAPLTGNYERYSDGLYLHLVGSTYQNNDLFDMVLNVIAASEDDNFTTLVFQPQNRKGYTLYFGQYSNLVRNISKERYETLQSAGSIVFDKKDLDTFSGNRPQSIYVLQSSQTKKENNTYDSVTLALIHPDTIRDTMRATVKINSHTGSFKTYVQNVYGLNGAGTYLTVYAQSFEVSLGSFYDPLLSIDANSWTPTATTQNNTISFNVPFCDLSGNLYDIPISYPLSSVSLSFTNYTGSSDHNVIKWTISKNYGWSDSQMNGYVFDNSGGACKAIFRNDNSSPSGATGMQASGRILYNCNYIVPNDNGSSDWDIYYYSYWSSQAYCYSTLATIWP